MSKIIDILKELKENNKSKSEEILLRLLEDKAISIFEIEDMSLYGKLRSKDLLERRDMSYYLTELGESIAEDIKLLREEKEEDNE